MLLGLVWCLVLFLCWCCVFVVCVDFFGLWPGGLLVFVCVLVVLFVCVELLRLVFLVDVWLLFLGLWRYVIGG